MFKLIIICSFQFIFNQFNQHKYIKSNSLRDNEGITDKSVPALKEMLQTSAITNKLYLKSIIFILLNFESHI